MLPRWVQRDIAKWKDGSKFDLLVKETVNGKSVYTETTFEVRVVKKSNGNC
jgi:hypothetical protein